MRLRYLFLSVFTAVLLLCSLNASAQTCYDPYSDSYFNCGPDYYPAAGAFFYFGGNYGGNYYYNGYNHGGNYQNGYYHNGGHGNYHGGGGGNWHGGGGGHGGGHGGGGHGGHR